MGLNLNSLSKSELIRKLSQLFLDNVLAAHLLFVRNSSYNDALPVERRPVMLLSSFASILASLLQNPARMPRYVTLILNVT